MNNSSPKASLYLTLGFSIIITVGLIMSLQSAYTFIITKNKIIQDMKQNSELSITSLEKNITALMSAYAPNEYDKLIRAAMEHQDNFAIVVNDYYMANALGIDEYVSGKIRTFNGKVINYDTENIEQNKQIKACFYSLTRDLKTETGEKIGSISVFMTDQALNRELKNIITDTLINLLTISVLLIVTLFITVRIFVLKPLSNMVTVIQNSDNDGIPLEQVPIPQSKEISLLASSMNTMITSIQSSRIKLHEQNKQLNLSSRVFNNTHEAIIITDANTVILDVNPAYCKITGFDREDVIGQKASILNSGKQDKTFYTVMWQEIKDQGHWQGELWNRKKNGELFAELLSISTLTNTDNDIINYVGVFTDITQHKHQQDKLKLMAHYDILTGLPNRALFVDRFHQAIAHSKRSEHQLAVCFLDLDDFKPVNDNYGHEIGDQLLIEVAKRITSSIREEDTVSRQGGDEFALLLNDIESFEQCQQTIERILQIIARPYAIEDSIHKVTASIGITLFPDDNQDIDTLIRHADNAMYQAKQSGKQRYHFFDRKHDQQLLQQRHRLSEIEHALVHDELTLHYQPKVNMTTGAVFGAEALLRWLHPEKGLIPPLDFLPIIDNTDLELQIGDWVILQALEQLNSWLKQGLRIEVSVNIASQHLQSPTFFPQLDRALAQYPDVDSSQLQLEILESSALSDLQTISNIVKTCQDALGVTIALDDFGTGYSSLTHLRSLTANTIKIDQSFVRDMLDDPNDYAIIDGVIGLADTFGREVIAEGVETIEHGTMLLMMGCNEIQGYAISRPLPATDFSAWLSSYKPNQQWLESKPLARGTKENKIETFKLIGTSWKNKLVHHIQSSPTSSSQCPIMDGTHCHCGQWIKRAHKEALFSPYDLERLSTAHNNMHRVSSAIHSQYQTKDIGSARKNLSNLLTSFDEMMDVITSL